MLCFSIYFLGEYKMYLLSRCYNLGLARMLHSDKDGLFS